MTKMLGRGLGMATLVLALVGVPALSAYADSGTGVVTPVARHRPPVTAAGVRRVPAAAAGTAATGPFRR